MASIDEARLLRGEDIVVDDVITLHQPTLNEIIDYGEQRFFANFYSICAIPSDFKSMLDDSGLDFMEVTDWQLFIMLTRNMSIEDTSIVIPNIDFSKLEIMQIGDTGELVLTDGSMVITEETYMGFIGYIREQVGYVMKREKAANKFTKRILIDEDRAKRKASANKEYESMLNSMIVSLVNTEEFSYSYKTVYEITFYQLLKSFTQIQKKKAACAKFQGCMSGFVDTSKVKQSDLSWVYEVTKKV